MKRFLLSYKFICFISALIEVRVHDSTIRETWQKHGIVPKPQPLLTQQNTKARLTFTKKKKILMILKTYGKIFCGLTGQKLCGRPLIKTKTKVSERPNSSPDFNLIHLKQAENTVSQIPAQGC
ncbi:hypothetical protein XENORESO_000877 [Xenotaenia resolanae]|uniref:Transposase n=1 Tax=Xenotaenia resolanae TaxID=208358 RepID=A0ABV0X051_9TELE